MITKRVVVVSSHGLFREGLKHLLADSVMVDSVTSIQEIEALMRVENVNTVIIDRAEAQNDDVISRLLSIPELRIILVSLDSDHMQIYQHKQIIGASKEDLIAAIQE